MILSIPSVNLQRFYCLFVYRVNVPTPYQTYRPIQPKPKKQKTKALLFGLFVISIVIISLIVINKPTTTQATTAKEIVATTAPTQTIKAVPMPTQTTQLESAWKSVIDGRQGSVAIAVYNSQTGKTAQYSNTTNTFDTASIVKVSIAEAMLVQEQSTGMALTSTQLSDMTPMIENSDNDTTSTLWSEVGGKAAMDTFFGSIGAASTTSGANGFWGLTQTTATDQLAVINAYAYPGPVLTNDSAATLNSLLDNVETDQSWGVSAGIPSTTNFELKNGWLEDSETNNEYSGTPSWTVNSIGHIWDNNADYTIAVLTNGQTTEQYGIDTIESLSAATWNVLSQ
jgi:beta-lactamase class A